MFFLHIFRQPIPAPQDFLDTVADVLESVSQDLLQQSEDTEITEQAINRVDSVIEVLSSFPELQNAQEIFEKLNKALEELQDKGSVIFHIAQPGRPAFHIPEQQLQFLLEFYFGVPEIARLFDVSISTIRRRMAQYGLTVMSSYSSISDTDLRAEVSQFLAKLSRFRPEGNVGLSQVKRHKVTFMLSWHIHT